MDGSAAVVVVVEEKNHAWQQAKVQRKQMRRHPHWKMRHSAKVAVKIVATAARASLIENQLHGYQSRPLRGVVYQL